MNTIDISPVVTETGIATLCEEEFARRQKAQQDMAREASVTKLRANWELPKRYATCKELSAFGTPRQKWAIRKNEIQMELGKGLLIAVAGGRGTGKTQMAASLMKHCTDCLRPALYTTAIRFFMRMKTAYKKDSEKTEEQILNEYRKPSLLVIDEIGKRADTEWENNLLFELINSRYGDLTDTLLIDNRSKEEQAKAIGDSLVSRINESGGYVWCDWPSWRE